MALSLAQGGTHKEALAQGKEVKGMRIPVRGHDWSVVKFGSLFSRTIGKWNFSISSYARTDYSLTMYCLYFELRVLEYLRIEYLRRFKVIHMILLR